MVSAATRHILPSFSYSSAARTSGLECVLLLKPSSSPAVSSNESNSAAPFNVEDSTHPGKKIGELLGILRCIAGSILSCDLILMVATPLDFFNCNRKGHFVGCRLLKEQGVVIMSLLAYSAQGACNSGFYESFEKKYYSDINGPDQPAKYKASI